MTFSRRQSQPAAGTPRAAEEPRPEFEALFQQHWTRICAVLYRLVGDWDEAEDLALDVFVRLYHQPPQQDHNLGGWLYRVATNLGFNALRARKRRQHYENTAGVQGLEDRPNGDPAALFEQAQERRRVRQALAGMKARSAQILILRHSGLSYAEIAQSLGLAVGSVGTLLARAEAEFAQAYQQQEGD